MPGATDERKTLELVNNHAAFKATLVSLTMSGELHILHRHVYEVARRWFELGRLNHADALAVDPDVHPRCAYSRAYYAAYNASKAVRYVVQGAVSLKGDDHRKVADLPDSFPDVDLWTSKLPQLYEHRLRADYDNWSNTTVENILPAKDCVESAGGFLKVAAEFLRKEYGLTV
jgi:HEPN domain-containing protein